MTKEKAQDRAQRIANETGNSTIVYLSKSARNYGVSFTLPRYALQVGGRYYPQTVTDEPWDTLTPGKGEESDNSF
jgi:hypothetical protein